MSSRATFRRLQTRHTNTHTHARLAITDHRSIARYKVQDEDPGARGRVYIRPASDISRRFAVYVGRQTPVAPARLPLVGTGKS